MAGGAGKSAGGCGCSLLAISLVFILAVATIAGGTPGDGGGGTLGTIDRSKVPPQYLAWVLKAGQCDAVQPPVLTPAVIAAQIEAESNWQPDAKSPAGALGIAQFMAGPPPLPDTWASWGRDENGDGDASPLDPADAIMAQGRFDCSLATDMKKLLDAGTVSGDLLDLMLAAYNAGPGAVERSHGVPPYMETQTYVSRIRNLIPKYTTATTGGPFGDKVVAAAHGYLGTNYVWGGGDTSGPTAGGFDCSGLVMYAVAQASGGSISLPHSSEIQVTMGTEVINRADMKPGDIIGFELKGGGDYDHIGIYIGNNQMIHAPHTGDVVREASLDWYAQFPWKIRRFG